VTVRVAVVGAGAVGATAAHDLASRGASVTVYEREDPLAAGIAAAGASSGEGDGDGATGRAAGLCHDAQAGRVDARVADRAMERFRALAADPAFEFVDCPYVWLARAGDERRGTAIRDQVARMRARGRDVELLDTARARSAFPALAIGDAAVVAVARNAGYADPAAYRRLTVDRAVRAGADVRTGVEARIDPDPAVATGRERERFDAVVVAAGAHTRQVVEPVGSVPLKAYRVQAAVTGDAGVPDSPMLFDATGGYYLRPHRKGLLVGDGTVPESHDPDGWEHGADEEFVAACPANVRTALGTEPPVNRAWAGLCTATPDGDPLLGELGGTGVFVATGWHGHGFMRAPATGEAVADLVLGEDPIEGIGRFSPDRFDGDEAFEVIEGMTVDPDREPDANAESTD